MHKINHQDTNDINLYDIFVILQKNKYIYIIICLTLLFIYLLFGNIYQKFTTNLIITNNKVISLEVDNRIFVTMSELGYDDENIIILLESYLENYDFFIKSLRDYSIKNNENFTSAQIIDYYKNLSLNIKDNIINVSIVSKKLTNNDSNFFKLFFITYIEQIREKLLSDYLNSVQSKIKVLNFEKQNLIDSFALKIENNLKQDLYELEIKKKKMELNKKNLILLYRSNLETAKKLNIIEPKTDSLLVEKTQIINVLSGLDDDDDNNNNNNNNTTENLLSDTMSIPIQYKPNYLLGVTFLQNQIESLESIDINKIITDEINITKFSAGNKNFINNELLNEINSKLKLYEFVALGNSIDKGYNTEIFKSFKMNPDRIIINTEKYKFKHVLIILLIGIIISSITIYLKLESFKRTQSK